MFCLYRRIYLSYLVIFHNHYEISAISQYDILCLPATFVGSSILSDNNNLDIPGNNAVRTDLPANTKRGGVCIYFSKISSFTNIR